MNLSSLVSLAISLMVLLVPMTSLPGLGVAERRALAATERAYSEAMALNERGQAVGYFGNADRRQAVLWERGMRIDLNMLPGGKQSMATDINDAGQIVGWSDTANGESHAALWDNGKVIDLGTLPGGLWSTAEGITEAGEIVGWSGTASGENQAVRWVDGRISTLAVPPGSPMSVAWDINEAGSIVGLIGTPEGDIRGAVWKKRRGHRSGHLAGGPGELGQERQRPGADRGVGRGSRGRPCRALGGREHWRA